MDLVLSVIFAWISVLCMVLSSIIYFLRIAYAKKKGHPLYRLNRVLRKHHKWLGIGAVITGLIHGLNSSLSVLSGNKGTILTGLMILLGLTYVFRKQLGVGWFRIHRGLTIVALVFLLLHIVEVGGFVGVEGLNWAVMEEMDKSTEKVLEETVTLDDQGLVENQHIQTDANAEGIIRFAGLILADGVYEGVADGYGPDLETEVIVEGGQVVSVEVTDHNEKNSRFYSLPIATLPDEMVLRQELEVDSVSGATMTSYGIMMSVENALEKAVVEGQLPEIEMPEVRRKRHQ